MRLDQTFTGALAAMVAAVGLAGCGDGASAVETRPRTDIAANTLTATSIGAPEAGSVEAAAARTVLTANRRETVDAKIQRLYARNGADFEADSAEDFLAKVTAFTSRPPAGVETATRPNGDTLMYQASTNTFAVVARNGSPRTMFKPDDGPAYWAEQKASAATFGQRQDTE